MKKKTSRRTKIETFSVSRKEKEGFVSEPYFCKKYDITEAIFTRWIMRIQGVRVTAGYSNVRYKESDLLLYLHQMK